MSEWIYVGIEYPLFNENVILTDGQKIGFGYLSKDKATKFWRTHQDLRGIIAWMPLPDLPNNKPRTDG